MLGEKHLDCGMGMMDMPEKKEEKEEKFDYPQFSELPCCENNYVSVEADELFKKEISNEAAQFFVAATIATILYSIEFEEPLDHPIPVDTSPRFERQDYQVLHQVFQI